MSGDFSLIQFSFLMRLGDMPSIGRPMESATAVPSRMPLVLFSWHIDLSAMRLREVIDFVGYILDFMAPSDFI